MFAFYLRAEVELISLMDRNGIGTDATIAQHISTIQDRAYATKDAQQKFLPTKLGIALVEGYNRFVHYVSCKHFAHIVEIFVRRSIYSY